MLIYFGASWPVSIIKTWTSGTIAGKSIIFLIVIFIGYISGVIHKIKYNPDKVIFLYMANGIMILIEMRLYIFRLSFKL